MKKYLNMKMKYFFTFGRDMGYLNLFYNMLKTLHYVY